MGKKRMDEGGRSGRTGSLFHSIDRMLDPNFRAGLEGVVCPCVRPVSKDKGLLDDGKFTFCTRVGAGTSTSILLYGKRTSFFPFQMLVGPDWPVVVLVFALILGVNIGVLRLIAPLGWPVLLIGSVGFLVLLCSYACVSLSDPGIIYKLECDNGPIEMNEALESFSLKSKGREKGNGNGNGGEGASGNDERDAANSIFHALGNNSGDTEKDQGRASDVDLEDGSSSIDSVDSKGESTTSLTPIITSASSGNGTTSKIRSVSTGSLPHVPKPSTMECGHCQLQRPLSARHCIYCGSCIEQLDHHCPWCGKCIGKRNKI